MTIRYLSFDFDGCLFNKDYVELPHHNNFTKHLGDAVLNTNRKFLNWIKKENAQFSEVYAFIGSTRQDYYTDVLNGYTRLKGSCCPSLVTICKALGIHLDPLMLADIEGDLKSGTSFSRIMDEIKNNSWGYDEKKIHEHVACAHMDEYKRTILFAQMQKAAADHPGEEIIFDFFDDRLDILTVLENYFTKHSHMMPKNVRLRLHAYAGQDVSLRAEIPGTGNPISDYRFFLKKMHEDVYVLDEIAEALKETALQPTPEEKILSVLKEIVDQGLYISDNNKVGDFLANSDAPFVAHPSRFKANDLFTFTTSHKTSKGISHIRYGLDLNGELFFVEKEQKTKVELLPEGLVATLTMYAEQATQVVEEGNLDELVAQPEPQPIKVSKVQALYQQIIGSPYFVEDAEQVTNILSKNPHFPFVVRKSSTKVEGMITFTTVYDTNKGIVFTRYGINDNGELFQFDEDKAYKIKEVSSDLLSVLQEQTLVDLKRVNQAKSIEDVTFHRGEKEVPQTQRLFVGEKGFFAHSAQPQSQTIVKEQTLHFEDMQP